MHVTLNIMNVVDFMKITDQFRGIYGIYLKLIMKNRKIRTYNRLDLETLGFGPVMIKFSPCSGETYYFLE